MFKELLPHVHKIECLLIFALLDEHFQVEVNKFEINFEVGLLHELQKDQVGDVQNFGLKLQIQTEEVHRFDGPLRIYTLLVSLVQIQPLRLLLKKLIFANIGKKELLTNVSPIIERLLHSF